MCCYTLSFELFRLLVVLGKWPRNVVAVCVGVVGALWLDVVGVACGIGTISGGVDSGLGDESKGGVAVQGVVSSWFTGGVGVFGEVLISFSGRGCMLSWVGAVEVSSGCCCCCLVFFCVFSTEVSMGWESSSPLCLLAVLSLLVVLSRSMSSSSGRSSHP